MTLVTGCSVGPEDLPGRHSDAELGAVVAVDASARVS